MSSSLTLTGLPDELLLAIFTFVDLRTSES